MMNLKKLLLAAMAATILMVPQIGLSQEADAETPAEDAAPAQNQNAANRPEDNWLKVCETLDSGETACVMRQVVLRNNNFRGSFLLRDDPSQESRLLAIAALPLGVLLPFKMAWQIDNGQVVGVPYMLCDPNSCIAQLVVNEAYVNSLKRGAVLKLIARNRQNKEMVVEINLAGFTAVYEGEAAQTIDEANNQSSGQNALERMLQDRAEELRREMGVEGEDIPAEEAPAQ